jgi:hypothetical protein
MVRGRVRVRFALMLKATSVCQIQVKSGLPRGMLLDPTYARIQSTLATNATAKTIRE